MKPASAPRVATYKVNEIFDTIQGEGSRTGRASTFLRLQGCDVGCAWCDTKHTWHAEFECSIGDMLQKTGVADPRYAVMDLPTLVTELAARAPRHIVITGGEPAMHNLAALTYALALRGVEMQLETSATYPVAVHENTWVTCSPKIGMPGGRALDHAALARANEIKMPVGKARDVDRLVAEVLPYVRKSAAIFLQPLSCSKAATRLCTDMALQYGWSVSVQVHKFMQWR